MTKTVLAGPDPDRLGDALEAESMDVVRIDGIATGSALEKSGIESASLYVLTDVGQATSIPVALDMVGEIRVVVYARESLPEFAKGQADLLLDPDLLDAKTVAEELTGKNR
jgi:hypothetical protein